MPKATEEDFKGYWEGTIRKGAPVYDKDTPIEQDSDAWTNPSGTLIDRKHPQMKDFPNDEYEKLDLPKTYQGKPVHEDFKDLQLVRPKAKPVVGEKSKRERWYG
jgi:hypothetical protein